MATTKNRVSVSLSDLILAELEEMAKERGLTKSTLITILIMDEYARRKQKQKQER